MIGFQQCPHNHSYLHFIHFPNCDPFSFPGISRCYLVHATKHSFHFGICRVTQHVISFIYLHVHRRLIRAHPIDCCSAKELLRAIGWLAKKAVQENFVSFFTNTLFDQSLSSARRYCSPGLTTPLDKFKFIRSRSKLMILPGISASSEFISPVSEGKKSAWEAASATMGAA